MNEEPEKEEPFTVAPITPVALTLYVINLSQKNVPSVNSSFWLKSKGKVGVQSGSKKARKGKAPKPSVVKPWTHAQIEEAFRRFQAANPEPQGELKHINPFTLLVAVVLSAQATDAGVNKATPALFAAADTPEKMVALGEQRVRDLIKTIGLFRTKAKNVVELSRRLVAEHGGQVHR